MSHSTASTAKLTTKIVETVNDNTDSTTSFCFESNEPHENQLQVPKSSVSLENQTDAQRNSETSHISLRSSITNIAAEVFATKHITVALKCKLVTTLVITICLMILLFLAPIIWYNTNPPSAEAYVTEKIIFHNLEINSCTVS